MQSKANLTFLYITIDYAREAPIGALARSEDNTPASRSKRASVNEDMRYKQASVNEDMRYKRASVNEDMRYKQASVNEDMRYKRASVNEDMRYKRLSDSSMQADQLTKLTKEKGERGEITPLHRKISRGAPTTEELVN